jgi:hypothetical protein
MSLTQPAPDDSIDLELGEVYYGGQKALEDQLANEIIVVTKEFIDRGFAKDAVRHCVTLMPKITDACEPFFVLTAISKTNCG